MNIQSPFNPDLVENNANVLPDSAFSNKEREDGRGLPKV